MGIRAGIGIQGATKLSAELITAICQQMDSARFNLQFIDANGDIDESQIATSFSVAQQLIACGTNVVLTNVAFPSLTAATWPNGTTPADQMSRVWALIAQAYSTLDPRKIFFEPFNEPDSTVNSTLLSEMTNQVIQAIRAVPAHNTVLISSNSAQSPNTLKLLTLPDDKNIMATIHMYWPMNFTHQGASWIKNPDGTIAYPKGVTCCDDAQELIFTKGLETAAQWSLSTGVPVVITEFGTTIWADTPSRLDYSQKLSAAAQARNMPYLTWDFGGAFRLYDIAGQQWDPVLLPVLKSPLKP